MKTYKINNKEYTEFDINKRCAELMGVNFEIYGDGTVHKSIFDLQYDKYYNPLINPSDTWPIIERVWDNLNESAGYSGESSVWSWYIYSYRCTKLVAACICLVEMNS